MAKRTLHSPDMPLDHFWPFSEPPKSFSIVQNNNLIQEGSQITVVDGQVSFKF